MSPARLLLLLTLAFALPAMAQRTAPADGATLNAPSYTAASIVNAATYSPLDLAPGVIASIYGTNLSFDTGGLSGGDYLPFSLAGVTVFIGGIQAGIFYVSPTQVNFLIPAIFLPVQVLVSLGRDTLNGGQVTVQLNPAAPSLFASQTSYAIATHLDGSLISSTSPAKPGEWVVLYGTGMGPTIPGQLAYELPTAIAPLQDMNLFSVLLNGTAVDHKAIYYAGIAPGNAGLYQVNLKLPDNAPANPQIQISSEGFLSPAGIFLAVQS
jgi:uncharacterized protein (TIGR03437 family)